MAPECQDSDDADEPVSGASVAIINNFTATAFSGSTNSSGSIAQQTLDERIENASGVFVFSPYSINASKTGYYGNSTAFSLTADLYLRLFINPVLGWEAFYFNIESPENGTYMQLNLSDGKLDMTVTSPYNMTSCNYSFGGGFLPLDEINSNTFQAYANVSAMDGPYDALFTCRSEDNETNTSGVFFTIHPSYECQDDAQCAGDEECSSHKCIGLECDCGYAANHACVAYDCCGDGDCAGNQSCNLDTNECERVLCDCPEKIANHKCSMQPGYCCKDMLCAENETCDLTTHACIERRLSLLIQDELAFGSNMTVKVVDQDGDPVPVVRIDVKYPAADPPAIETYYTDSSGLATIQITHAGRVEFVARKTGYFLGHSSGEVPEPFNFIFLIEVIVLIAAAGGIAFTAFRLLSHRQGGERRLFAFLRRWLA